MSSVLDNRIRTSNKTLRQIAELGFVEKDHSCVTIISICNQTIENYIIGREI